MTRLFLAAALAAVGCTSVRPVGPLAKMAGPPPAPKGAASKDRDRDGPPEPSGVPAVKPTPPLNTVGADDVSADPYAAARRLTQELEADRKTVSSAPVLVQTSRIKGGMKQE